jgi:RNA polymerase sigma factor (sigma-70 family)
LAQHDWPATRCVAAAQEGDAASIAVVVEGAHPHVRRFAEHLCATPQDAEDAAQEALIILYSKIGTLRASAALASWMFRIVRNECLRRARRRFDDVVSAASADGRDDALGSPAALGSLDAVVSAEDEVLRRLDAEEVARLIQALPDLQRRVLVMRDVLGYSGGATADRLGLSTAAMKSQLHRARSTLRAGLRGDAG